MFKGIAKIILWIWVYVKQSNSTDPKKKADKAINDFDKISNEFIPASQDD